MLAFQMCTDAELSIKRKYPTFARTCPVVRQLTASSIALLKNFNWYTVALITEIGHSWEESRRHLKINFGR